MLCYPKTPLRGFHPSSISAAVRLVNPVAAILSAGMMLQFLGEEEAAQRIENSVKQVIKKMKSMLINQMGYATTEVGDLVVQHLSSNVPKDKSYEKV